MTGTAYIDVAVEVLPQFLAMKPTGYHVLRSMASDVDGVVRLLIESDDIVGHGHQVTMHVKDNHSIRTASIVPVAINRTDAA